MIREAVVTAIIGADGLLPAAHEGDDVEVVLDVTPFYAEGGGQLRRLGPHHRQLAPAARPS